MTALKAHTYRWETPGVGANKPRPLAWIMALCFCAAYSPSLGQAVATQPQTRAERTNYRETSSHADVMEFLKALQKPGAPIRVEIIGKSPQGKDVPLAIVSKPMVKNATEARKQGKVVIYIQANIHGGEVEGKEAAQMLLRDLLIHDLQDSFLPRFHEYSASLLKNFVFLVTPIYNIDGNEKLGPNLRNRSSQDGPEQVGERPNGQGLDLNRDCMKAASNEMQAALKHIYRAWEPDVVFDLHTTDGTRHGFNLTYAPPLNPNTDPGVLSFTRDKLLPKVRTEPFFGLQGVFDYGNVEGRGDQRAWRTFGEESRYVTNYAGIRGKVGILSETASFLPFADRVRVTHNFVGSILVHLLQHKSELIEDVRTADRSLIDPKHKAHPTELGVRFEMARGADETFQLEKPNSGVPRNKAPVDFDTVKLPVYDRFKVTRTAKFPAAYLVPASETKVIELLQRHGVSIERIRADWKGQAEAFTIGEVARGGSNFSGQTPRLEGKFETTATDAKSGDFLVRANQPLGRLLFMLLEPESLDGVSAWGFLATEPKVGDRFPILKLLDAPKVATEKVMP